MSFWDRPMTDGEIAFCVQGFFTLSFCMLMGCLYEIFGPKKIRVPRLYWHPETREWRTDGSFEMCRLALECAKAGDKVTLSPGKHTWIAGDAKLHIP